METNYSVFFLCFADRASQFILELTNLMNKICFTISLFHASTCFEHHVLNVRRSKLYYTASGIITPTGVIIPNCIIHPKLYYTTSGIITAIGVIIPEAV